MGFTWFYSWEQTELKQTTADGDFCEIQDWQVAVNLDPGAASGNSSQVAPLEPGRYICSGGADGLITVWAAWHRLSQAVVDPFCIRIHGSSNFGDAMGQHMSTYVSSHIDISHISRYIKPQSSPRKMDHQAEHFLWDIVPPRIPISCSAWDVSCTQGRPMIRVVGR